MPFAGITGGGGFFSGIFKKFGMNWIKNGLSGLAPGGEGPGSPPVQFPSYGHLKVGMKTPSEAGEVAEIETADVIDIAALQQRIFNPPYQKTEIVIPPIMRV